MKITIDHPASSYGIPVILDDKGKPIDYPDGVREIRRRLGLSAMQLGEAIGISGRTVQGWEQGRAPDAAGLNLLGKLVSDRGI